MKKIFAFAAAIANLGVAGGAQAGPKALTEAQARAIIAPWYSQFNVATRGDVKAIHEKVVSPDFEACNGYLPGDCRDRDTSIRVIGNLGKLIPDLTYQMKEVLVSGDRVIVLGEAAGTPVGELYGVPYTGKSFGMMTLDMQTIKDGKIVKTIHMENWLSALTQLRAK